MKTTEAQKRASKKYYQSHKKDSARRSREYSKRHRAQALKLYGSRCFFCKLVREDRLLWHRKDGVSHGGRRGYLCALREPDAFVLLCYRCHRVVHWMMECFSWSWEKIISIMERECCDI